MTMFQGQAPGQYPGQNQNRQVVQNRWMKRWDGVYMPYNEESLVTGRAPNGAAAFVEVTYSEVVAARERQQAQAAGYVQGPAMPAPMAAAGYAPQTPGYQPARFDGQPYMPGPPPGFPQAPRANVPLPNQWPPQQVQPVQSGAGAADMPGYVHQGQPITMEPMQAPQDIHVPAGMALEPQQPQPGGTIPFPELAPGQPSTAVMPGMAPPMAPGMVQQPAGPVAPVGPAVQVPAGPPQVCATMNKGQLIAYAHTFGLQVNDRMTKDAILQAIGKVAGQ
jgi:hypothetical protein